MKPRRPIQGKQPFRQRVRQRARKFARDALIYTTIGVGAGAQAGHIIKYMQKHGLEPRPAVKAPAEQKARQGLPAQPAEPNKPRFVVEPNKPVAEPNRPVERRPISSGFPKPSVKMSILLAPGAKCLSADFIDAELKKRKSPAAGFGKAFVNWGQQYKIRPDVALAFFRMESTWGTKGKAAENKSIGNIAYTPTSGSGVKYVSNNGFRRYASWNDGIQDFCWLLSSKVYAGSGLTTLEQIIPKYAPAAGGNNPVEYQKTVVGYLDTLYKEASK